MVLIVNLRRASAASVTVSCPGSRVCVCVCGCLSTTILAQQAMARRITDIIRFSAASASKIKWQFSLSDRVLARETGSVAGPTHQLE